MSKNIMCRIIGHQWDRCKCKRCGVIQNANHVWDGCRCTVCYSVRNQEHKWQHCKCTICGQTRNEEHSFSYDYGTWRDDEVHQLTCKFCRKTKDEAHQWFINEYGDKRCSICGYTIYVCQKCGSFDTKHQEIFDPEPFEMRPCIRCQSCGYEWRLKYRIRMR